MSHNPNDIFDPTRYGLITGSKCNVLFPKKSAEVGQRTYAKELANQMYFRYYDNNSTWQTEHGNMNESTAFEYYQERFDKKIVLQPGFKRVENWGGSADCLGEGYGIDFKCPTTLNGWLDYMHEGIDEQQYYQAQMYMFLHGIEHWKVCAFLSETERMTNEGEVYPVPYDKRMIKTEVEKEQGWEEKLRLVTPKIITMRDEFYSILIDNFGPNPNT